MDIIKVNFRLVWVIIGLATPVDFACLDPHPWSLEFIYSTFNSFLPHTYLFYLTGDSNLPGTKQWPPC